MALKTITFTVGVNEIKPATIQDGGIQGDHKKTELRFDFNDELYNYLQTKASNGKLVYRFDATDGEGTVHHSDTANLTGRRVTYPLEYTVTCHGGLVKVELIISCIEEKIIENKKVEYVTNEVLHTEHAQLKLTFAPYSTGDKSQPYKDISTLAKIVKDCAERAVKAEEAAIKAQEQTDLLSAALNNGTTFIFSGGNASSEIDANFVIDSQMSDYSNNAVANSVAKKYVDDKYPVGSVWVGGKKGDTPIDPSTIFGGEWEMFDKEFKETTLNITDFSIIPSYATIFENSKITNLQIGVVRSGKTMRLRIGMTSELDFTDTGAELFELNWNMFGIDSGIHLGYQSIPMLTDYANGGIMVNISYDGKLTQIDFIGRAKTKVENGKTVEYINSKFRNPDTGEEKYYPYFLDVTFPMNKGNMLDSFCDKFYWQRKN
jgi:hypothetical protein